MATTSFNFKDGVPTTPITVNGKTITNPDDVKNLIAAEKKAMEVADSYKGKPITQESRNANREARAAVNSAATVAGGNATAGTNPATSAGANAAQAQTAKDDRANTQSPQANPAANTAPGRTNAVPSGPTGPNAVTSGTNAPTRPSSTTQAVPPPTAEPTLGTRANWLLNDIAKGAPAVSQDLGGLGNPFGLAARAAGVIASAVRGAFLGGDDVANPTQVRLRQIINAGTGTIVPQANPLDQYASYTYNISLYIMSQTDYVKMVNDKKHVVPGSQLLMQSGGISGYTAAENFTAAGVPTGKVTAIKDAAAQATASAGRNQYFPLDYYLDDLKIEGLTPGKGTRAAHGITNVSFKIIEPNGITLLDNLYSAVQAYTGQKQNYTSQNYLFVIDFYGYDETGKLAKPIVPAPGTVGDPKATIQKFIPFQFTNIKFRVAKTLTEYECTAVVPQNAIGSGQSYGVIPYNVELDAGKLSDLFNSKTSGKLGIVGRVIDKILGREASSSTTTTSGSGSAPPKAGSAPSTTITNGLVDAINKYEKEHVEDGIFEIANEYDVQFSDPVLGDASTVPPGSIDKAKTSNPTPSNAAAAKNPNKGSMGTNSKKISATAGTTLLQFLDKTIRSSTYIYDQQTQIYDPSSDKMVPQANPLGVVGWYRIGIQVEPKGYDFKRNDYAYKITYQISPFLVADLKSPYFPRGKFRGTHKQYFYWFTGANTQILNYDQDFNALYYNIVNSEQMLQQNPSDFREVEKRSFQTRSNEGDQGSDGKVNEPSANAATELYSPTDLSRVKLTILGDPAWIAQGEVWSGVAGTTFSYDPFLPDGTINGEAGEPMFEIGWNKPADYDLNTGIQTPYQKVDRANAVVSAANQSDPTNKTAPDPNKPTQSNIFRAINISSMFSKGKFTQDLQGVLVTFPVNQIKPDRVVETRTNNGTIITGPPGTPSANTAFSVTRKPKGRVADPNAVPGDINTGLNSRRTKLEPVTGSRNVVDQQNHGVPLPIPPAAAPTSNGQAVGNANAGTSTTPATFNPGVFAQKDPAGYQAYNTYKNQSQQAIYATKEEQLIAQARRNNPGGRVEQAERNNIATAAQVYSQQQADILAQKKFGPAIIAAGAGTPTTVTNDPAVNTTPQIFNKEF